MLLQCRWTYGKNTARLSSESLCQRAHYGKFPTKLSYRVAHSALSVCHGNSISRPIRQHRAETMSSSFRPTLCGNLRWMHGTRIKLFKAQERCRVSSVDIIRNVVFHVASGYCVARGSWIERKVAFRQSEMWGEEFTVASVHCRRNGGGGERVPLAGFSSGEAVSSAVWVGNVQINSIGPIGFMVPNCFIKYWRPEDCANND